MKQEVIQSLQERGIYLETMAELVYELQKKYLPSLTFEEAIHSLDRVLSKREVQYAVLTGLALDKLAEQGQIDGALGKAIQTDEPLFGIDEVLGLSIATIYGSVGATNFGYLDKIKPGLIGTLDTSSEAVHTFADDLVCAIVAAAAARLVHRESARLVRKNHME